MKKSIFTFLSLAFLGLSTANAQVGIGTNTPNASAVLELESTDKGFLPPRMANRPSNPVDGLTIYNTTINCLEFFNGTGWKNLCDGSVVVPAPLISGGACDGEPEFFTFKTLEYKPVESSGKCWLDRNLGASQVATSSTDADSYGDLYQWGRFADGHEERTSGTAFGPVAAGNEGSDFITTSSSPNDWLTTQDDTRWGNPNDDDKGPEDPCPPGYRVPTFTEWSAERSSWSPTDLTGAFASPLKLPVAGDRDNSNGSIVGAGTSGVYWSSTLNGTNARSLAIGSTSTTTTFINRARARGKSVRCIKD